jgi:DNA-binding MarR family transcriptional regulator
MKHTSNGASAEVERFRLVVLRLARRLRRESGPGVTPSQATALSSLARNGSMAIGRLAEREQITKSSVTRLVSRLEELGLVTRSADPADGRSWVLDITDQGQGFLAEADRRAGEYLARQFDALPAGDRQTIVSALPALERLLAVKA